MNKVVHEIAHHTRPDGSPYPIDECKIYCAFQNLERSHVDDEVFWRADGSSFPVEYWSHPIFEGRQVVGAVVSFIDISKRVEVEKTKELMFGELDHRVKNLLATIKAIATQTMRRETDPQKFMGIFTSRVDALAKAHSLLTQTAWQGASLIKVLKSQLAVGTQARDGAIRMQGPDVMLSAHMTMNLGMMLHELGTNAAKYGALSKPSGYVSLDWDVIEQDGDHRLQMTWKEHGGPPVLEPERKGFGTVLIERSLQRTHGSRVEQIFERDGLRCVVDVHLSQVE